MACASILLVRQKLARQHDVDAVALGVELAHDVHAADDWRLMDATRGCQPGGQLLLF